MGRCDSTKLPRTIIRSLPRSLGEARSFARGEEDYFKGDMFLYLLEMSLTNTDIALAALIEGKIRNR
jgi:hypothetical protein